MTLDSCSPNGRRSRLSTIATLKQETRRRQSGADAFSRPSGLCAKLVEHFSVGLHKADQVLGLEDTERS